jgi:predicted nucleic acid-binding protein
MGSLTLRVGDRVYVDTPLLTYTVERHPIYEPLLRPVWRAAARGDAEIATSELTLLEAMVMPERNDNRLLLASYERFLHGPGVKMAPIDRTVLRRAISLRAHRGLKTPDAIHAATALEAGCTLFVTNDPHFRRGPGLIVVVLDDVLAD